MQGIIINTLSHNVSTSIKRPVDSQYYYAIFWIVQCNLSSVENTERLCNILFDFEILETILCERDNIMPSVGNIVQYPVNWS